MPDCTLEKCEALTYREAFWIPEYEPLRTTILLRIHDSYVIGYIDHDTTLAILSCNYYWPGIRAKIKNYINKCKLCWKSKAQRHTPYGHLHPMPVPNTAWQIITL